MTKPRFTEQQPLEVRTRPTTHLCQGFDLAHLGRPNEDRARRRLPIPGALGPGGRLGDEVAGRKNPGKVGKRGEIGEK